MEGFTTTSRPGCSNRSAPLRTRPGCSTSPPSSRLTPTIPTQSEASTSRTAGIKTVPGVVCTRPSTGERKWFVLAYLFMRDDRTPVGARPPDPPRDRPVVPDGFPCHQGDRPRSRQRPRRAADCCAAPAITALSYRPRRCMCSRRGTLIAYVVSQRMLPDRLG